MALISFTITFGRTYHWSSAMSSTSSSLPYGEAEGMAPIEATGPRNPPPLSPSFTCV